MIRLLQIFCVMFFLVFVTLGGISLAFLTLCSLYTPLAPLTLIYVLWIIVWDRRTPERGGRRAEWMRKLRIWNYIRDYFPITLVKTAELPPDRNYLIGVHPHGVLSVGASINFCTEATGFSKLFPGITPYMTGLRMWFIWPFFRECVLLCGACCASRSSIDYLLSNQTSTKFSSQRANSMSSKLNAALLDSNAACNPRHNCNGTSNDDAVSSRPDKGANGWIASNAALPKPDISRMTRLRDPPNTANVDVGAQGSSATGPSGSGVAIFVVVGGAQEALDARPDSFRLTLKDRKGFVRKAVQHGADLVPAFSFGENEIYTQIPNPIGSSLRWLQVAFKRTFSVTFPLVYGAGPLPFARPIATVVGTPIRVERCEHPTPELVDALHAEYCCQLEALFEAHKANYGISECTHLELVSGE